MDQLKKANRKCVYQIIEVEGKKPVWQRIGVAFVNRDSSLTVMLDSIPARGKLHIRDFKTFANTTTSAA